MPPTPSALRLTVFWAVLLIASAGSIAWDDAKGPNTAAADVYGVMEPFGWDIRTACYAAEAYNEGRDPYFTRNMRGTSLNFPYLSVYLDVLRPVCLNKEPLDRVYKIIYPAGAALIILLLCGAVGTGLKRNPAEALAIAAWVVGGFSGFHWVFRTGNISLFMDLFLAGAIYSFALDSRRNKPDKLSGNAITATVLLGLGCSMKFYMAPLIAALIFLPKSWRTKIILMIVASASFALIVFLSWALHPDLFGGFLLGLQQRIPGQLSLANETCSPSLYCMTKYATAHARLFSFMRHDFALLQALYGIAAIIFFAAPLYVFGRLEKIKNLQKLLVREPRFALSMILFTMFAITILMPRVKEYGYFDAAVFAAPLLAMLPAQGAVLAGLAGILWPLLGNQPRLGFHSVFHNYDQPLAAIATYWIAVFYLAPLYQRLRIQRLNG